MRLTDCRGESLQDRSSVRPERLDGLGVTTGCQPLRANLRRGSLDPAPALGRVIKLGEALHLAAGRRRLKACRRARLQGGDMAGERRIAGQAEEHHCPRRGRTRRHRYPLHRHQSAKPGAPSTLRAALLRPAAKPRTTSKAWKNHLAADRTAEANQFRLFLHAGAYWLLWSVRRVMPKGSVWRILQFDTLRLRLIKLAARVVELNAHSDDVGRAFRLMSATCSDRSRPAVPIDVGRGGGAPAGRV